MVLPLASPPSITAFFLKSMNLKKSLQGIISLTGIEELLPGCRIPAKQEIPPAPGASAGHRSFSDLLSDYYMNFNSSL